MPLDFTGFEQRKSLSQILSIPKEVQSVYSLTQHVWSGKDEEERRESKRKNQVRLSTLDELLIDPVRGYLNRILEKVAENDGQGWWLQAEFGVGKSHLLAATSILAIGGEAAWEHIKKREDEEKKAGPGARLDSLWRKKMEKRRVFPIVFSLEGVGGTADSRLEDFILEEAQRTFALRENKPLAVYPEEHLANLFIKDHQKTFKDEVRTFLADKRLMRGLPTYDYDGLIKALKDPQSQRDAGRLLLAFYKHRQLVPKVPVERGERLARMVQDVLDNGYQGIFIAIDEMSEYLRRRAENNAEDEDCLLVLSNTLAKVNAKPVWTIVAAQMAHTNPQKIIAPDRLSQEILEHKPERFRDIVVQRTRKIEDPKQVNVYFQGYRHLVPWVKESSEEEFEAAFPFPPDALGVMRSISAQLTGTRSTIGFLHRALKKAAEEGAKDIVPLWRVFDDLMSYSETPSTAASGTVSIRSRFRDEVAALESAQNTLKRITDGQLARPQNRKRAERILNTLFLYHLAGVPGLDKQQILDAVCDLKPNEDELEAQLAHYEVILTEMVNRIRNQVRLSQGRYEFVKRETSQYDDLLYEETDRLRRDPQLLAQWTDRLIGLNREGVTNQFAQFASDQDGQRKPMKVDDWHGQERSGRVAVIDLSKSRHQTLEIDAQSSDDDFLIVFGRRPVPDEQVEKWLQKEKAADPRLVVWVPAQPTDDERSQLADVVAKLKISEEKRDSTYGKQAATDFKNSSHRAYTTLYGLYSRGIARTSRGSVNISSVGGVEGALATMAKEAMDTCYRARDIDFGNRKFDTPNAVKLINGLVKRGAAVSEGDALWSAVENFAPPLGLVRKDSPKRLDPNGSEFYREIRKKVEEQGALGIEVRTVYNWFTGYKSSDGKESCGLTRRMVDVYLLALAQQGVIRISQTKGGYVDRSTIATIDFKPETLRGFSRIELPRALQDWEAFYRYLEVLVGRNGQLGPRYDKAAADDALAEFWENRWINRTELETVERDIHGLFEALGKRNKHPFDDLLLFWLEFADEPKPEHFTDEDVYTWLQRAVLKVAGVSEIDSLTAEHLNVFTDRFSQWNELRSSFQKTSSVLRRAARFAFAAVPKGKWYERVATLQGEVRAELDGCEGMILNPDAVNTRLAPRLNNLEPEYVDGFISDLMRLERTQKELQQLPGEVLKSEDALAVQDFATEVTEAKSFYNGIGQDLDSIPKPLRDIPEDRERAQRDLRREAIVRDLASQELSWARLHEEVSLREKASSAAGQSAILALRMFAGFLLTPSITEAVKHANPPATNLKVILDHSSPESLAQCLRTTDSAGRRVMAKELRVILGNRVAKIVSLSDFHPSVDVLWEKSEISDIVQQFSEFLNRAWQDGSYLKLK